jgi:hypothetical protein
MLAAEKETEATRKNGVSTDEVEELKEMIDL